MIRGHLKELIINYEGSDKIKRGTNDDRATFDDEESLEPSRVTCSQKKKNQENSTIWN